MRQQHELTEAQRLELIVEAVRYCQRVKAMGMPSSCYSKALREPLYFLWECRNGKAKDKIPQYRSKASMGLRFGKGELRYDHAIPFCYLERELLKLSDLSIEAVMTLLLKYETRVLITKAENDRLTASGLQSEMPSDWDHRDPLSRYRAVGIELVPNGPAAVSDR